MKKYIILFVFLALTFKITAQETLNYVNNISVLNKTIEFATDQDIAISKQKLINYKENQDIQKLLLSIHYYPTGEAYYLLADYFFMNELYSDAINLYTVSIQLNYEKKYYSFYNIACAYSLTESYDDSYDYLMKAFEAGYRHFEWSYKDTDLSKLMNSLEYGDWISYSIEKHREKYYKEPIDIALYVYNNNLTYQDYKLLKIEWDNREISNNNNYKFSILSNRSTLSPVPLILFCFDGNQLSFIVSSEKINYSSKKIVNPDRNITFYLTFYENKDTISNDIIEKAKIYFTHRV